MSRLIGSPIIGQRRDCAIQAPRISGMFLPPMFATIAALKSKKARLSPKINDICFMEGPLHVGTCQFWVPMNVLVSYSDRCTLEQAVCPSIEALVRTTRVGQMADQLAGKAIDVHSF